jgi:acyl-coenzyme A thioesterase PaaI-like protein
MPTFNSWLGLLPGEEAYEVVLDTRPEHEVAPGTIHFAVLATLGEVAAAAAVEAAVVPADVQVQLLARARPGRLMATGTLLKRGGRLAFARGEVRQEGRLVAAVAVTFAFV